MNASTANLLNAVVLIVMGVWGYMDPAGDKQSFTALIPAIFGVILLACSGGVKKENKVIAHIAVVLTLLCLIALCAKPLPAALDRGGIGVFRVGAMILTCIIAMIFFIKSFRDARIAREQNAQ